MSDFDLDNTININRMIFDSVGPEPSHRNFSTQLSRPLRHKPHF